jgi:hypothetical protein
MVAANEVGGGGTVAAVGARVGPLVGAGACALELELQAEASSAAATTAETMLESFMIPTPACSK